MQNNSGLLVMTIMLNDKNIFIKAMKSLINAEITPEYRFIAEEVVGLGAGIRDRLREVGFKDWRFDYALKDYKIAVEIEGGVWVRGRHNRATGYLEDMEKYNAANTLGWHVLRYPPNAPLDKVCKDINKLISYKLNALI